MNWIGSASAVVSLLAMVVTIWQTREAKKSADAASRSALADERAADAAEATLQLQNRYVPKWRVTPTGAGSYQLINRSDTEDEHDVNITFSAESGEQYDPIRRSVVHPKSVVPFSVGGGIVSDVVTVTVNWVHDGVQHPEPWVDHLQT